MSLPAYLVHLDPPGLEMPQHGYTRHRPILLSGRDAKTGQTHPHISSLPLNCAWRCLETHRHLIGFITGTKCESVQAHSAASTPLPHLRIVGEEEDSLHALVLMVLLLKMREEWKAVEHPDVKELVAVVEGSQAGVALLHRLQDIMREEMAMEKGGPARASTVRFLIQLCRSRSYKLECRVPDWHHKLYRQAGL